MERHALGGVLTLRPVPGDGTPEISWGDSFFYYAPDGVVPTTTQPFATIVTKDYPDDEGSQLNRPGVFRLNIATTKATFQRHTGHAPSLPAAGDPSVSDTVIAHPVYGRMAWLAVVDPGPRTGAAVQELLTAAHDRARSRYDRKG
ncbi:DUF6194 family protein [Antrihabitans cavernicola]|uniref:DUF6194 domain-containing protein n=1 Tax=Antrihabitans cavernicola TaxID=2495913 RepID=A0A5A7S5Z9_9NOCA|nr:DUF6194 family protein [Spelaeibacter cavernicola]KAA0021588.1 hypothetical protein FOY51_18085 [Spelaeibacter cavernicola]